MPNPFAVVVVCRPPPSNVVGSARGHDSRPARTCPRVIDGNKCHELIKNVGANFAQQIILPAVEEVTKASTALFPVEKIIQEIEDGLKARLSPYWITVQAVSITNITFSHDFSRAIEQKQVEEQNVQGAEFVRQQAEKEGQRQLALAEGQAKANRLLQDSLKSSPEVLQMKALDKLLGDQRRPGGRNVRRFPCLG